ncbi:MAG: metal-dependent hydrolase [Desulfobacteraceae bacterium]|jgi:hypothetical protein
MPNFKEHIGWAIGGGIVVAAAGLHTHHLQPIEGIVVVALAGVSGNIPDIDKAGPEGKESIPFRYFTNFLSSTVPFIVIYCLNVRIGLDLWMNIGINIALCTIIFSPLRKNIRKYMRDKTIHRGIMHSIPFAFLCAEVTYLIFISDYRLFAFASEKMPEYFATAVFVGCLTHLAADEHKSRKISNNPYIDTSFVLYSDKLTTPTANVSLYLSVIVLFFAIKSQEVSLQSLLAMLIDLY